MNPLALRLRHRPDSLKEPDAWFIRGGDVSLWIDEICRWQIPQEHLRLFVLPCSLHDPAAAGVLVVPSPGSKPACVPRALGFAVIAGKLYLPVDAELWPPVEPGELKVVYDLQVFHPAIGLVGFETTDALGLSNLLRKPPSRVENWNFARPGVQLNSRLISIQLLEPVSLKQLFGDAPGEIGSDSPQTLPPAPDEPWKNRAGKLGRQFGGKIAGALANLLRHVPAIAPRRTWINDLQDWAAAKAQRVRDDLERMRQKELHRLLHQLEQDPDLGLRHALPLSRLDHRGQAPPTDRLGSRPADFDLNRIQGGQPADFWDVSAEIQRRLREKYLELANRELQLGRFRRAAYIFAELLGDLEAAASALKQGRHFREAAILYRDHLRRPREAAVCLAEGGLLAEAIAIYEQEALFLEAAELYVRLGQIDQARAAWHLEAERRLLTGRRIEAAALLEDKLNDPEAALVVLREGWPHSAQAGQCLNAEFELLARKSWHDRAAARLQALCEEPTRLEMVTLLARILASHAVSYPDRLIRHRAADLVRIKISRRLEVPTLAAADLGSLGDSLVKLAPGDKLLARDVFRFCTVNRPPHRTPGKLETLRKMVGPVLIRSFNLPQGFAWHAARSCASNFFAAGSRRNESSGQTEFLLVRGDWEGRFQRLSWPNALPGSPMLLEVDEESSRPVRILVVPGPTRPLFRLPGKAFPAAGHFPGVIAAGTPEWLADDLITASTRGETVWLLREINDGMCECRTPGGRLIRTLSVASELAQAQPAEIFNVSLLAQREHLWLSAGNQLFMFSHDQVAAHWQTESQIVSLVPSAPHLPVCAVARLERGVALHWVDALQQSTETLCHDLPQPLATFTANGTLVLVSGHEARLCTVTRGATASVYPFSLSGPPPLALLRAEGPNHFALLTTEGKLHLFRVAG